MPGRKYLIGVLAVLFGCVVSLSAWAQEPAAPRIVVNAKTVPAIGASATFVATPQAATTTASMGQDLDDGGFDLAFGYTPMHYDEESYHEAIGFILDWLLDSDWDLDFGFDLIHTTFVDPGSSDLKFGATDTSYWGGVQYSFWGEDDFGPFGALRHAAPFAGRAAAAHKRHAFSPFVYAGAGLNHEFGANGFLMQFGGGIKKPFTKKLWLRLQGDLRIVRVGGFTAKGFGAFFGVEVPFTHKKK